MTDLEDKLAASVKKPAPVGKKTKKAQSRTNTLATKAKKTATAKSRQKRAVSDTASELHPQHIWPD